MSRAWRIPAIGLAAIALGLAAGLGGAWLGLAQPVRQQGFPQTVAALLDTDAIAMTPDQTARVAQLRRGYEVSRKASGERLQSALVALTDTIVQSGDNPQQVEDAANLVDGIVHERRMDSIRFIKDVGGVLDARQRQAFNRAFRDAVVHDNTYSQ